MILLDTNVLSELARPAADPIVVTWVNAQPVDMLYTTVISEAEILYGLACLPPGRRQDNLRRAMEATFAVLLAGRVLPFDRAAARAYADLAAAQRQRGRALQAADLQIAAIARARGADLIATRNVRDFADCGVAVVNPWVSSPSAG